MLLKGSIFYSLKVTPLDVETYSAVQKFAYQYRYQPTKNVCPFIDYCVAAFETVFSRLILRQFLFILPIVPNNSTHQLHVYMSYSNTIK